MSCRTAWSVPSWLLLLLALLAVTVTMTAARRPKRTVDCREVVYHEKCRGVFALHRRSRLHGLGRLASKDLLKYLSKNRAHSEARELRALNRFLSPSRPRPVSDERRTNLLQRLLSIDRSRIASDYSEDDYSDSDYLDDFFDLDL